MDFNMKNLKISALYIAILVLHSGAFAQTALEEAGNESLAALAAIAHGTELGLAEGCRFPKTVEFRTRFKEKLFEVKISQLKKNQFLAGFEEYRKESRETVMQGEPEFRELYCAESKDMYLESNVWQDDWVIGGN